MSWRNGRNSELLESGVSISFSVSQMVVRGTEWKYKEGVGNTDARGGWRVDIQDGGGED